MGRRLNSGRGQSSLGYLFGGSSGGEADNNTQPPPSAEIPSNAATSVEPSQDSPKPSTVTIEESSHESYNVINRNPNAAVHDYMTNNYHRPDGQNCGNYITNRPLTKVHAAPVEIPSDAATSVEPSQDSPKPSAVTTEESSQKPPESYNVINRNPNAAVHDHMTNNYHRPDGQNCGNYITNRPLTKVHAAPVEIPSDAATSVEPSQDSPKSSTVTTEESSQKPPESYNVINRNPNAAVHDHMTNNYHRPDGQNCGNYITNRPLTKVHAAPVEIPSNAATSVEPSQDSPKPSTVTIEESSQKPPESYNVINRNPNAAVHDNMTNNYHRPDGQNYGNYITNRPLTKVHAAPGGNSSLDYLFKDDRK